VRNHGVGFYGFSKDEEVRAGQLKELKKISEETDATRKKVSKERSDKKSALTERLKKVRAKKRAKLGLPPQKEEEESSEEEKEPETKEEEEEEDGPSSSKRLDIEEGEKVMRAWDFGKPGVFGPQPETFDELDAKWLKDRRADRQTEFAPPSLYKK
jgi:hydroxylamine reductase (hybrid-cluster protein)